MPTIPDAGFGQAITPATTAEGPACINRFIDKEAPHRKRGRAIAAWTAIALAAKQLVSALELHFRQVGHKRHGRGALGGQRGVCFFAKAASGGLGTDFGI